MEMANESTEECKTKGKIKLRIEDKIIILTDVYYLKASKNIIRLTKFMAKGYQVIGEGDHFLITKDNKSIISTSKIKTKNGFVLSIDPKYELNNINYDLIHQRLGHPGKNNMLNSEEILGEKISTSPSSILPLGFRVRVRESHSLTREWMATSGWINPIKGLELLFLLNYNEIS